MKLLLDTHIWVWSVSDPLRVKGKARDALVNPENQRWLSPISVWEAIRDAVSAARGGGPVRLDAPATAERVLGAVNAV